MVDLDAEVSKLEKKLGLAQMSADKIKKLQEQPDYEKNLPDNVRAANAEKVSQSRICRWTGTNIGLARDTRGRDFRAAAVDCYVLAT